MSLSSRQQTTAIDFGLTNCSHARSQSDDHLPEHEKRWRLSAGTSSPSATCSSTFVGRHLTLRQCMADIPCSPRRTCSGRCLHSHVLPTFLERTQGRELYVRTCPSTLASTWVLQVSILVIALGSSPLIGAFAFAQRSWTLFSMTTDLVASTYIQGSAFMIAELSIAAYISVSKPSHAMPTHSRPGSRSLCTRLPEAFLIRYIRVTKEPHTR